MSVGNLVLLDLSWMVTDESAALNVFINPTRHSLNRMMEKGNKRQSIACFLLFLLV